MTANRISRLPIAEFCGRSGELDLGSGRAAAMSTAFHAICSVAPDVIRKTAALTEAEREELKTWHRPTQVPFDDGTVLTYEAAEKESTVGIDSRGRFSLDPEVAVCIGHLDMAWTVEKQFNVAARVCYVGDIKKTHWTTLDGPESLQLHGYGFALAAREHATHYACGLWIAEDGVWNWGKLVDLESSEAADVWDRILHAATNQGGEFRTGGHCRSCYSRLRCPAYLVPVESTHALAPLNGGEVTNEQALHLLHQYQRAEDTLKAVGGFLKEYARRTPIYDPATKKRYMAVECAGKESVNKEALLRDEPQAREKGWIKKGAPYDMMRWVKA